MTLRDRALAFIREARGVSAVRVAQQTIGFVVRPTVHRVAPYLPPEPRRPSLTLPSSSNINFPRK